MEWNIELIIFFSLMKMVFKNVKILDFALFRRHPEFLLYSRTFFTGQQQLIHALFLDYLFSEHKKRWDFQLFVLHLWTDFEESFFYWNYVFDIAFFHNLIVVER